jgi:hypothetical protein
MRVSRPEQKVRFQVRSPAPLKRVALTVLRQDGKGAPRLFDVADAKKTSTGYELTADATLHLAPGVNTLRVEAENAGGAGEAGPVVINFVPPPVALVLDSLEPRDGGPRVLIHQDEDGKLRCPPAPRARMTLRGKVVWDQADPQQVNKRQYVSVFVNGAQQWRGELEPARVGERARAFTANVLLSSKQANYIEVDVPGLNLDENDKSTVVLGCTQPLPEQWLHVQVISPDDPSPKQLMDDVRKKLEVTDYSPERQEFVHLKFIRGKLYRPMTGDVDPDMVAFRLLTIKRQIAQRARDGWPNDVVVVYYVGGEKTDDAGRLKSLTHGRPAQVLITRDKLEEAFNDMLGVKVVLLDVSRAEVGRDVDISRIRREVARWLDPPSKNAWLRAAWLGAGSAPLEARLLTAVHGVLLETGDLRTDLDRRFRALSQRFITMRADWWLPAHLDSLVVSQR